MVRIVSPDRVLGTEISRWVAKFIGLIPRAYDEIWDPSLTSDGQLLYCARRGSEYFVVHGTTEGNAYDELFSLRVVGNEIVYGARKGRKLFRVTRTVSKPE